jgi:cytochrome P450
MYMICDVLGLPQARYEDLITWANQYASMLAVEIPEAVEREADHGFAAFVDYVAPLLEARRREPRNDLLSEWVAAQDRGELAEEEIAGYALFTFTGGQMTTTLLMANALFTLKRHPDQWEQLVAAPEALKETMVDEVLRYESSSRALVPRWASQDIELLGRTVPKGAMIIGIEAAANRDPKYFDDPERFDIGRPNNAHLAFGGGPHVCPGQFVARVETQELMASLAKHYPGTSIEGEPQWLDDWIVRGLDSLPVRLTTRSTARTAA